MAKKITDFSIINKVMVFDKEVYRILEHVGKKYQFNKEYQIKQMLGECELTLVDAIDTPSEPREMLEEKIFLTQRSMSRLRFCELQFNRLNDDGAISNKTMALIIEVLSQIYADYSKLIRSLRKKLSGSDVQGCAPCAETDMIRTADCGTGGGPDA